MGFAALRTHFALRPAPADARTVTREPVVLVAGARVRVHLPSRSGARGPAPLALHAGEGGGERHALSLEPL